MEKVTIEDIEPLAPPDENIPEGAMADTIGGARPLSEPLNATELSINHYKLAPGESFAHSSHQHSNQEEVFYVQSGTVTFETEHEDLTVDAGEILRVPPRTFQLGTNCGDERVTALALGAPREYEENTRYLIDCEECGERTAQVFEHVDDKDEFISRCIDCDTETHRISY
jgi:mannose-6-phosphate isomerase-like protein (cupin superfamily)